MKVIPTKLNMRMTVSITIMVMMSTRVLSIKTGRVGEG